MKFLALGGLDHLGIKLEVHRSVGARVGMTPSGTVRAVLHQVQSNLHHALGVGHWLFPRS